MQVQESPPVRSPLVRANITLLCECKGKIGVDGLLRRQNISLNSAAPVHRDSRGGHEERERENNEAQRGNARGQRLRLSADQKPRVETRFRPARGSPFETQPKAGPNERGNGLAIPVFGDYRRSVEAHLWLLACPELSRGPRLGHAHGWDKARVGSAQTCALALKR